jgi:hypothetical protein
MLRTTEEITIRQTAAEVTGAVPNAQVAVATITGGRPFLGDCYIFLMVDWLRSRAKREEAEKVQTQQDCRLLIDD